MPNIQALRTVVSDKTIFFRFSQYKSIQNVTPGRAHFWPKGHNLNNLGRCLLGDSTYKISRPCSFRQDFFHISLYISLCKTGAFPLRVPGA